MPRVIRDRDVRDESLSTPWPASCGPAPGPMIVTSPIGERGRRRRWWFPRCSASGSSRRSSSGSTRAVTVSRSVRFGELERRDVLEPRAGRCGLVEHRARDVGDPAAGDLLAPKLPAEDERRQDHQLRHRVVALDVRGRVTLGKARPLSLRERVLVGRALGHPGEDEVGGRVEQAAKPDRDRAREPIDERAEHRRSRHDGRFGRNATPRLRASSASSTPCSATGHLLDVTTGIRAPERLAHVREAGLAVAGRARRHLHEQVGFGGAQPFDRARPARTPGCSAIDRSIGRQAEQRPEVESVAVVDEPVSRVGETDDRDADPVPAREPLRLRVERAHEPPAHRAEAHQPDPQRLHRGFGARVRRRRAPAAATAAERAMATASRPARRTASEESRLILAGYPARPAPDRRPITRGRRCATPVVRVVSADRVTATVSA